MYDNLTDFLEPINLALISHDEGFTDKQLGNHISVFENDLPSLDNIDAVIVGCGDLRGDGISFSNTEGPNAVRSQLYNLFHWHSNVQLADLGNIKIGASLKDTYAALQTVIQELIVLGKKVIIIGGSHDLSLAQYNVYATLQQQVNVACVDAVVNLNMDSVLPSQNFLMPLLTSEPNYVKHYTHIGFQSYLVHPQMLETIDKLRFDCYRVGKIKESIEEMEPVLRQSQMLSFDIQALQHAHAPSNSISPNGFNGEEACSLLQYAGMSNSISTVGIYGLHHLKDNEQLTAKQISHMIWYFMDGIYKSKQEASLDETEMFNQFNVLASDFEISFVQSKRTGRWWMKAHNNDLLPCSKTDYLLATNNEIPERWMRYAERH
jgi:formiminoglutamase